LIDRFSIKKPNSVDMRPSKSKQGVLPVAAVGSIRYTCMLVVLVIILNESVRLPEFAAHSFSIRPQPIPSLRPSLGRLRSLESNGWGYVQAGGSCLCRLHAKSQSQDTSSIKSGVPEFTVEEKNDDEADESDEFVVLDDTLLTPEATTLRKNSEIGENQSSLLDATDNATATSTVALTTAHTTAAKAESQSSTVTSSPQESSSKVQVQYAALEAGTVVHIQVGDVSRARKAWKKRRRTDSPLLVPCSVLNVDLASTVRWNLIYLLEKFGQNDGVVPLAGATSTTPPPSAGGIRISLSELSLRSRTHLKASLSQHAIALGYPTVVSMVKGLFSKPVQDAYGVKLVEADHDKNEPEKGEHNPPGQYHEKIWLETPLSRLRAQSRASQAAILQFLATDTNSPADTLVHTGVVRNKRPVSAKGTESTASTVSPPPSQQSNMYQLRPLSAALRVNQDDVDGGMIAPGSLHAAVVFDYDPLGDAGVAPLLTLSLNPQRNQVRDRLKHKGRGGDVSSLRLAPESVVYDLANLQLGQGPMVGKVVRLVKGGALVDCGVGRRSPRLSSGDKESGNSTSPYMPVYGVLRFKDAVMTADSGDGIMSASPEWLAAAASGDDDDDDDDFIDGSFSLEDLDLLDDEDEEGDDEMTVEDSEINEANDPLLEEDDDDDMGEVLAEFNLDNDDEFAEGEDITHLFELYDDGRLAYKDPETGETTIVSDVILDEELLHDHDDDDDDDVDELELDELDAQDQPTLLGRFAPNRGSSIADSSTGTPSYKTHTLRPGDRIPVFVKSVPKQSSHLFLTMDPTIQGMTAKQVKRDGVVAKKQSRLIQQLGGFARLRALTGISCQGVVQAVSASNIYVQPELDNVPVGVAQLSPALSAAQFCKGDLVLIQLNGIDPERGQLAMQVLKKLSTEDR
jgi:hypothetical protein